LRKFTLNFILFFIVLKGYASESISINFAVSLIDTSITKIAIEDVQQLLSKACQCEVNFNRPNAAIQINLPSIDQQTASAPTIFSTAATFPYRHYPNHDYTWKQEQTEGKYILHLTTTSWQGVSFGLYGLLQEKLGFKFYHPRETVIPNLTTWPLTGDFIWQAKPFFDKKGFHLHTQHPLELTEQLHDGTIPNALEDIKQYIDWLARNGQNYFEFCLLENMDRKVWINHARNITNYVHQRGLIAAVDLSLHMIQQKTFQLYVSPINKKKQIEKNLAWLNEANWDVINMEFSTAEFISGNVKKKEELRQFIIRWIRDNSKMKLMGRQHVVRHENESKKGKKVFEWDSAAIALDRERGVLSHTVMFYDMTEENAPVYENKNQRHTYDFLLREHAKRETWYYPESAYWITFDVSVPMLLLPYLSARLADIDTCAKHKIPGHITFSSGWEWGYWMIDWSIARWSWQHTNNEVAEKRRADRYVHELLPDKQQELFTAQLNLQQQYLKDSSLMQWMTAMTITDEISIKAVANEFHPRPKTSYKYIRNKATLDQLNEISTTYLPRLDSFSIKSMRITYTMQSLHVDSANHVQEIIDGCRVTALRAAHRAAILRYVIAYRKAKLGHKKNEELNHLVIAKNIREDAQKTVLYREQFYRYPAELIARKRWEHTAYHFGYLFPVSELHFWNREEQQAKRNQYRPLFMNIWNIGRIVGLIK
jgi:hypothetical protein